MVSLMDKEWAKADKEALVEIVKFVQKQGLKGMSGDWKEFLNREDRKFGDSVSDPSKRSTDILIAFLNTFSEEGDRKIFSNFLRRRRNLSAILRHIKTSKEGETPLQMLVRLTVEHPKYMQRYTFPSQNEEWVIIPLGKVSKAMKRNDIIAVDCEMVLCEDGTEELVQVCVVDQNMEVKVNMLIKPKKAVIDYRTHITGISSKDLDLASCSLSDAQKSLKKLLLHGTILGGHSLHNDLQALKIDHTRVIDTSHIFKFAESDLITPSLNHLCKSVLGYDLRKEGEPHNCLRDAEAVMKLILAKLEHGADNPIESAGAEVSEIPRKKLLLHRIPIGVPYKELLGLFPGKYNVDFQGELKRTGKTYSTYVVFDNDGEAREAFDEMEGSVEKDSFGHPQKLVSLQLSNGKTTTFYMRGIKANPLHPIHEASEQRCLEYTESEEFSAARGKCGEDEIERIVASMKRCIEHDHKDGTPAKKRHAISEDQDLEKADRCPNVHGGCCAGKTAILCQCEHAKEIVRLREELKKRDDERHEIDKLKKELAKRDDEIFALQKIVSELAHFAP